MTKEVTTTTVSRREKLRNNIMEFCVLDTVRIIEQKIKERNEEKRNSKH